MNSAEKPQPSGAFAADFPAQPGAALYASQDPAEPLAETKTPLLAQEQIVKLQKILRSMDHDQLKSVLSALEPNVLRLCLHAIFGRPSADETTAPGTPQNQREDTPGLAAHAKMLAQSKGTALPQPQTPVETKPNSRARSGGRESLGRLSPRSSAQKNAKIYCPTEKISIDCLILDKSKTGALVFLDHTETLPEIFALYDIGDQKADEAFVHLPHKKCRAVWRKRNKMGVTFVA